MPYVAPSTVVAGQTYSAASHNIIVNDIIDHEDRLDTVQNAQYPARNVLVNGAMQFAQRGTSVTGISNTADYKTADRWQTLLASGGTYTQAITADVPTGQGFANALRMTCTTAITSLTSGAYNFLRQSLEGQTLQHIKKGTTNAQPLTLQFWVKGSTTGTYIIELVDSNNRSISASYTISAANTWEQKTITFPADTTGTIVNTNAFGLGLYFWLGAGSSFTSGTLNTTWNTRVDANIAVGQTNLSAAVNNYIQITGVQLEPGSQASPFEFVRYDDELRRCQRYYYRINASEIYTIYGFGMTHSTTAAGFFVPHIVPMRDKPSSIDSSLIGVTQLGVADYAATLSFQTGGNGYRSTTVQASGTGYPAAGSAVALTARNNASAYLGFSAEL